MTLETVRTVAGLRARIAAWRGAGETVGLVPTMGALHQGHLSLVRLSQETTARTVATIFVNPRQFREGEDLAIYPRDEATDAALLAAEGVDLLFAPEATEMYPEGHATRVSVPGLGDALEGAFRPGFFTGVATVVTKLLLQALPDTAFFGEKDYQQLKVIQRLAVDLDIPVAIESGATVREADGLAVASRNRYLSTEQRAVAPALFGALRDVASGAGDCAEARERLLEAGFSSVDYLEIRDAGTFAPATRGGRPARVLGAAWLDTVRLIDNVAA